MTTKNIPYKSFCWVIGTTSFRTAKLNLKIDTESLKRTRRCPENICKFIREKFNIQIYADNENKGDITFLEDINEIKKVIENNDIIKQVESDSKIYSFNCINWG